MKLIISVLAALVASCHAGFLFSASGLYGGVGIHKGHGDFGVDEALENLHIPQGAVEEFKSFAKVHSSHGINEGKIIGKVPEVGDSDGHRDHVGYVGLRSHGGFFGKQEAKSTNLILDQDNRNSLHGSRSLYSDPHVFADSHAHNQIKTIKVYAGEDGSDSYGGWQPLVKTIKLSNAAGESADHGINTRFRSHGGGYVSHNIDSGLGGYRGHGESDGHASFGANDARFGRDHHNEFRALDEHKEIVTIKEFQDDGAGYGEQGGYGVGDGSITFGGYGAGHGQQEIQTIKIIHEDDGTFGQHATGAQDDYEAHNNQNGYGEFSGIGSNLHNDNVLFKVIHLKNVNH